MYKTTVSKTLETATKANKNYNGKIKLKIHSLRNLQYKQMTSDMRIKKMIYHLSKRTSILVKRKKCRLQLPKMVRKCKKITMRHSTRYVLQSKEYYVNNAVRDINCPSLSEIIEAEKVVTAVAYARDRAIDHVTTLIRSCKNKVEVSLARLGTESISGNEIFAATALCGSAKHCSKAEAYFAKTLYDFKDAYKNLESIVVNMKGQSTNVLPLDSSTTWVCYENCKTHDVDILQTLIDSFKSILNISYSNGFECYRDIDVCSCE